MHEPLPCGRADASPAGNDKCISRTPSAAVSEAETTLGTVSRESSPMLERGPRLDEAMAGDHGTMWERLAATWMLCAWLLPGYASSLLPDFSVASAPVSDKQGQPREESTLIERLTATWVLLAWLGYLPAVDMGFQDDTTSERGPRLDEAMAGDHGTMWERLAATWMLCAWLLPGYASSLLPDFRVASAPVSDKQGQPREESTLIERLTATWVLLAWLGYLPAVDMGFQDDTTSERITFWERASASWALITWLGYGPASIACSACFLMLTCAVLAV